MPLIGTKYIDAARIIEKAQAAGLTIDSGNVVDLLADNMQQPLGELREIAAKVAEYNPHIPAPSKAA